MAISVVAYLKDKWFSNIKMLAILNGFPWIHWDLLIIKLI